MMNRVLLISLVLLGVTSAILFFSKKHLKTELNAANGQITELNSKIKGYENAIQKHNEAQERAGQTIEKVRTVIKTVKSDCDCWHTLVDDRVRNEIRNRRKNRK